MACRLRPSNNSTRISDFCSSALGTFGEWLKLTFAADVLPFLTEMFQSFVGWVKENKGEISSVLKGVARYIYVELPSALMGVATVAVDVFGTIAKIVGRALTGIADNLPQILGMIDTLINGFRDMAAMGVGAAAAGNALMHGRVWDVAGSYVRAKNEFLKTVPESDMAGYKAADTQKEKDRQTVADEWRKQMSILNPNHPDNPFSRGQLRKPTEEEKAKWSPEAQAAEARLVANRYQNSATWITDLQRNVHAWGDFSSDLGQSIKGEKTGRMGMTGRMGLTDNMAQRMDAWRQSLRPEDREKQWNHFERMANGIDKLAKKSDEPADINLHLTQEVTPQSSFMAQVVAAKVEAQHRSLARRGV